MPVRPLDLDRVTENDDGIVPCGGRPVEERHLEKAIRYMAYVVARYGDVYAPIFARLEDDLADIRRSRTPAERARRYMEAHTLDGGLKAIR